MLNQSQYSAHSPESGQLPHLMQTYPSTASPRPTFSRRPGISSLATPGSKTAFIKCTKLLGQSLGEKMKITLIKDKDLITAPKFLLGFFCSLARPAEIIRYPHGLASSHKLAFGAVRTNGSGAQQEARSWRSKGLELKVNTRLLSAQV